MVRNGVCVCVSVWKGRGGAILLTQYTTYVNMIKGILLYFHQEVMSIAEMFIFYTPIYPLVGWSQFRSLEVTDRVQLVFTPFTAPISLHLGLGFLSTKMVWHESQNHHCNRCTVNMWLVKNRPQYTFNYLQILPPWFEPALERLPLQ